MLSTDLVRATSRGGYIKPGYLKSDSKTWLEVAEQLIAPFEAHVGRSAGDLSDPLRDIEGLTPRLKVTRGLAKVLYGRTEIDVDTRVGPTVLREQVFSRAAASHPVVRGDGDASVRAQLLAEVGAEFGLDVATLERTLYADLKDAQRVLSFDTLAPEAL